MGDLMKSLRAPGALAELKGAHTKTQQSPRTIDIDIEGDLDVGDATTKSLSDMIDMLGDKMSAQK